MAREKTANIYGNPVETFDLDLKRIDTAVSSFMETVILTVREMHQKLSQHWRMTNNSGILHYFYVYHPKSLTKYMECSIFQ